MGFEPTNRFTPLYQLDITTSTSALQVTITAKERQIFCCPRRELNPSKLTKFTCTHCHGIYSYLFSLYRKPSQGISGSPYWIRTNNPRFVRAALSH